MRNDDDDDDDDDEADEGDGDGDDDADPRLALRLPRVRARTSAMIHSNRPSAIACTARCAQNDDDRSTWSNEKSAYGAGGAFMPTATGA